MTRLRQRTSPLPVGQDQLPAVLSHPPHPEIQADLAAAGADDLGVFLAHLAVIDDAGLPHPQPGDAGDVRLEFLQLGSAQAAQLFQAVGRPLLFQFVQGGDLVLPGGHHQLAAGLVGDPVLPAEAVQGFAAGDAVPGLQRTGLVIEPGMDHAAVVAGLVGGQSVFGLEHDDGVHPGLDQGHGRRQPDDAAADDAHVVDALAHEASS